MPDFTQEQYQAMYDSAILAYQKLMNGRAAEEYVDQNGERVKFTRTDLTKLLAWINWLRQQLGLPADFGQMKGGRPFKFTFGQRGFC